jgi:hypothetical protein
MALARYHHIGNISGKISAAQATKNSGQRTFDLKRGTEVVAHLVVKPNGIVELQHQLS